MTKPRPITLVAWDGSEEARRALLHTAHNLSRGRELAVVNVVPLTSIGAQPASVSDASRENQRALLRQASTLLAPLGIQPRLIEAVGDPIVEISDTATRLGADTIVVGRTRRHRLHRKLADRLVRSGQTDVLVVP
jgi:nucleotide-binding universal stress UspA family protein